MSLFAKRHFGVSALVLTAGLITGTLTDVAWAKPFQDAPPQQTDQQRVDAMLAKARDHMRNAEWSMAADAFQSVLRIQPGNEEAVNGLKEAQALLDQRGGIEDVIEDQELRRQQAITEFDNAMKDANSMLQQEQYTQAEVRVTTAMVALGRARNDLNETEFNSRNDRAQALLNQIKTAQRLAAESAAQRTIQEQEEIRRREREAEERRRQAQIDANLRRVRELQMQMKYDEALQTVDQILFIDETNPAALALRDAIQTTRMWTDVQKIEREKEIGFSWNIMENRRAMIPPSPNLSGPGMRSTSGLVQYPEDWPDLSIRRTSDLSYADTEGNRRVAALMDQSQIPLVDFQGNTVEQLFAYMERITAVDIHPDWKALEFIGVRPSDEVTLQLRNVSAKTVLSRMLEQLGDQYDRPDFAIQDGLVVVSSKDAIRRHTVTQVFDIKDLLFEAPYFDNAPKLDLDAALAGSANVGGNGFNGGGIGLGGGNGGNYNGGGNLFSGGGKDQRKAADREAMIDQIITLIQDNVEYDSWRDLGGDTGMISELNGNLIITNTPRAIQGIDGLLSMLREVRALQINVEGRFLTVDMAWFEKIGFDLDIFFNTNNTLRQQQLAVDPLGHLSDFFDGRGRLKDPLIYDSFTQTNAFANQIAFGQQFGVPDATGQNIAYFTGPVGQPIRNTQGFAPLGINQGHFGLVDLLGNFDADSFAGEILNNAPALSLGIQFLDDIQVDLLIEATQADRRNVVLTAPRLTLFNGQRSWVTVGTQTAIITALIPIVGDASGAFQPVLSTLTDGVTLDIEAVVSADRRYVCMTVITGVRQTVAIEEIQFTGAAGGGGTGGGDAAVFSGVVNLPTVEVAIINTTACIPDKGTILLGGQRLVNEVEVEVGVPILSKIPFINRFFTNRVTSKNESTLLILIRPEIIIQQENEDILWPGLSDQLGSGSSYGNF